MTTIKLPSNYQYHIIKDKQLKINTLDVYLLSNNFTEKASLKLRRLLFSTPQL